VNSNFHPLAYGAKTMSFKYCYDVGKKMTSLLTNVPIDLTGADKRPREELHTSQALGDNAE